MKHYTVLILLFQQWVVFFIIIRMGCFVIYSCIIMDLEDPLTKSERLANAPPQQLLSQSVATTQPMESHEFDLSVHLEITHYCDASVACCGGFA